MVSLFKRILRNCTEPKCPCAGDEKAWIEDRFLWLKDQFGLEPLRRPTLLPTREFFPKPWRATENDCNELVEMLCEFMKIGRYEIDLSYYKTKLNRGVTDLLPSYSYKEKGAAGLYSPDAERQKHRIAISEDQFNNPIALIATICHELGHVHLLGHDRLSGDEEDHEPLTDMLVIYFGAGIFTANSAFQFTQWAGAGRQGWSSSGLGYLSEPQLGYSLACYARLRGESDPYWQEHLSHNIQYYFEDSIYYLTKTGNTKLPLGAW